ncbi:FecR family protein [Sphingobacterium sp. xlx-130]|uniref:FecR family protein n=1 Tax=Sphingobacterium sp. xlx-130 TaxID=2654323 RepID=UPI0013DCBBE6|nr:FecR domain-containing protein [Sphingobacterium sp. xlx-130]
MTNQEVNELYLKFVAGKCTKEDIDHLIEILKSDTYRDAFPEIQQIDKTLPDNLALDKDRAEQLYHTIIPHMATNRKILAWRKWLSIAAALIAIGTVSLLYLKFKASANEEVTAFETSKKKESFYLPDGSSVTLNTGSRLRLATDFNKDSLREVWVEGEVYFDVAHNKAKPFVVHTLTDMNIKVLGTSFNVQSFNNKSMVILDKGSVEIQTANQKIKLQPGEKIAFNPNENNLLKSKVDKQSYTSWTNNVLSFENRPLSEVIQSIQYLYNCQIQIMDTNFAAIRFTGSIPKDSLNLSLQTLEQSLNCRIEKNNEQYIIKPL